MALFLLLLPPLFFFPSLATLPILFPRAPQSLLANLSESNKYPNLPYSAHYFPQQLDHFSYQPKSYSIFYQKFLMNSTFWERGEPIFVYTGNEGDIEWFAANTGFMMDIAPKFRALLVFIEHRYYGTSKPFGEKSYESADKLGYLNSAQALADYAVLIRSLKHNMSAESSPVVVFGGSYGGMLAAWFRLKYPQIAIGALASSAPILQFDDITPWSSFYDGVSQDYKMCRIIDGFPPEVDILTKVFSAASLYYNYSGSQSCFNIGYEADVHGLDGWNWQACTEMVMPMICSHKSMFPPSAYDYKEFGDQCKKTYGVRPRPHWITTEYGGHNIKQVLSRFGSNIIFSNGMKDPWSRGGVLENLSSSIVALVTAKGAHHVDFRSATEEDPTWLIEQRTLEVEIIRSWIDKYREDEMI
ncbi:hypothetical protein KFK09_017434 [Dendrobium nobile]|uniref:Lysosomal Pro-X carboxypeptidase n=1 Tax=Dendrobium nobile TaxID=94219 RepID=A0A8T3B271_DENNO|nr:hypothetical protein KFK09_017434 [Dendrobium nobile]